MVKPKTQRGLKPKKIKTIKREDMKVDASLNS